MSMACSSTKREASGYCVPRRRCRARGAIVEMEVSSFFLTKDATKIGPLDWCEVGVPHVRSSKTAIRHFT